MGTLIVMLCLVVLLIVLTGTFKINPFIALIIASLIGGFALGIPPSSVLTSIRKGIGEMMGSILLILTFGAMIGKLVADSGAAKVISDRIVQYCGLKYLQWGLMLTGLIIGIPLFYNVGFVLVIPIIFSLVYQYKLPPVFIAIPMLASLSVAHSLLPPHPSPTSLIVLFKGSMTKTFLYGILIAIPALIIAGPVFSKSLMNIRSLGELPLMKPGQIPNRLPGFFNSIFSALLPVFLLGLTSIVKLMFSSNVRLTGGMNFISDPSFLMFLALLIVTYTLGTRQGRPLRDIMLVYESGVKDIAMILLIIAASGAFKQVLVDSNAGDSIASLFRSSNLHPLVLGWILAAIIRICLGSATVAGLTAAGIIAPMMSNFAVDPNLMVLAIGSGSVMFSHVNDTGFWMFKEYFNISLKDTFKSWSLMETIVSVMGLIGVMILDKIL